MKGEVGCRRREEVNVCSQVNLLGASTQPRNREGSSEVCVEGNGATQFFIMLLPASKGGDRNRANERKEPTTTREEGAVECSLGCVRVFASTNFPEHRLTHRAPGEG